MLKGFYFLCTFLLSSFLLFAQSNFLPGSITHSTGEVVNGFVDYREWSKNPSRINFKKSIDETASSYTVEDLLGFEITGKEKYLRARIRKDMMPVRVQDMNVSLKDSFAIDTAFIRELFRNDRIGLYLYQDFKDHFYVSETRGEFVELIYTVNSNGVANNAFRNQLLTYFPELRTDAKVNSMLESLNYWESDLTGFFYTATNTKAKTTKKIKPVFFAGTGLAISTLKISGDYIVAKMDYNTSFSPVFFAGMDIILKRKLGAFVIRPQVSFYNLNYEGSYIEENRYSGDKEESKYVFGLSTFNVSLSGLYNLWNKPEQKIYIGVEAAGNFSNYKGGEITKRNLTTDSVSTINNLLKYEDTWFSVNAMTGIVFMERFEIAASIKLTGNFSTLIETVVSPSIYFLKLGYRF